MRAYRSADCPVLAQLSYDTVHSVNVRDCTMAQLHVHKDHQGEGIATALCDQPEGVHRASFTTLTSVIAHSFFEKRGYRVLQE